MRLVELAIVGLLAELIGGALGMGYGVASTSLLLLAGIAPASASAAVHMAEVGTCFASGLSHWRLKNIDWNLTLRLAVPGAVGSFTGAVLLSRLSTKAAAPMMSVMLLVLGIYILVRFTVRPPRVAIGGEKHSRNFLVPLGLVGGFVDSTGGGGWGPVTTSTLLSAGRTEPRMVIGSVDASKFLVSLAATIGFLISMHTHQIPWGVVLALLVGGVVAAPIGAWLARHLPSVLLGSLVGGFVILLSLRTLLAGHSGTLSLTSWLAFAGVWLAAIVVSVRRLMLERKVRREREAAPADELVGSPL